MGEAKRRKLTGTGLNITGRSCPDAFFIRNPDLERSHGLPLCGYLHILAPAADDDAALKCASVIADQLCWPEEMPPEVAMPMWRNPVDEWAYGWPTITEMKHRLQTAPVVFVCMLRNGSERAEFLYEVRSKEIADEFNAFLADALIPYSQAENSHG
jgi:hypothetical protein